MVVNTYNPNFAAYLESVTRTEFAVGPQNGNGEKSEFKRQREERNVRFSRAIQTYLFREERLAGRIKRLEERAKKEIGSTVPEGYTVGKLIEEYRTKLQSARTELLEYRNARAKAEQGLSQSALLLVVNIAAFYARKYGVSSDDLIGNGNVGLMRAARKFEGKRGFQFSTYATWWIRQAIIKGHYEEQRGVLNTPYPVLSAKKRLTRIEDRLTCEFEREPTPEEIADAYNEIFGDSGEVKTYAIRALRQSKSVLSLSHSIGESEKTHDIHDKSAEDPAEVFRKKQRYESVIDYLNDPEVTPNERKVIIHRFGLNGEKEKTLEETARIFKLTRERIRQIEAKAMNKLKMHFNPN